MKKDNQIDEYLKLKKQIKYIEKHIDELNQEFAQILIPLKEMLESINNKINGLNLNDAKIYIQIKDLVEEIASLTHTKNIQTELTYTRSYLTLKENDLLNPSDLSPNVLNLKIYDESKTLVNTILTLNFDDICANGKTLFDNTEVSELNFKDTFKITFDKEAIPYVLFKINFKSLDKQDTLENKAISNCLNNGKYLTEKDTEKLKKKNERQYKKSFK